MTVLPCADLEAMMNFYVDRLGFERRWAWKDPERLVEAKPFRSGVVLLSYR